MTRDGDQAPAGDSANADSAAPAGLHGADFLRAWKTARSANSKARRSRATAYVRVADRTAGSQYRKGMGRRPPPPAGGDDAA